MAILKLAALGALGYAGYKYFVESKTSGNSAFAPGESDSDNFSQVRNAGPASMGDTKHREWTEADEASDQSFPASDPPANY